MNFNQNLFALLLILVSVQLSAQKPLSRVIYKAEHSLSSDFVCQNGQNTLYFNSEESIFVHENYPSENQSTNDGYMHYFVSGDFEKFPIFISFRDSIMYSKVNTLYGPFSLTLLKENLDAIKWDIGDKQKNIKGYNCIVATSFHEGRYYEVWFTPEIPVRFGPFHLHGLPGLILEAKSLDNKVSWSFVGYELNSNEVVQMTAPKNGDLMNWDELVQARINYKLMKEARPQEGGATLTVSDPDENQYIRKGKFSIYKKYYKQK